MNIRLEVDQNRQATTATAIQPRKRCRPSTPTSSLTATEGVSNIEDNPYSSSRTVSPDLSPDANNEDRYGHRSSSAPAPSVTIYAASGDNSSINAHSNKRARPYHQILGQNLEMPCIFPSLAALGQCGNDHDLDLIPPVANSGSLGEESKAVIATLTATSNHQLSKLQECKEKTDHLETEAREKLRETYANLADIKQAMIYPKDDKAIAMAETKVDGAEKKLRKIHKAITHLKKCIELSQDSDMDDASIASQQQALECLESSAEALGDTINVTVASVTTKSKEVAEELAFTERVATRSKDLLRDIQESSEHARWEFSIWRRYNNLIRLGPENLDQLISWGIVPGLSEVLDQVAEDMDRVAGCGEGSEPGDDNASAKRDEA